MSGRACCWMLPRSKARRHCPQGYAITVADLEACCLLQSVAVEAGDVVLVRTGNERFWDDSEHYLAGRGVHDNVSRWLASRQVRAVGADIVV